MLVNNNIIYNTIMQQRITKNILSTLVYTKYKQSYELVIKVWLIIYVFPGQLNLGKHTNI